VQKPKSYPVLTPQLIPQAVIVGDWGREEHILIFVFLRDSPLFPSNLEDGEASVFHGVTSLPVYPSRAMADDKCSWSVLRYLGKSEWVQTS